MQRNGRRQWLRSPKKYSICEVNSGDGSRVGEVVMQRNSPAKNAIAFHVNANANEIATVTITATTATATSFAYFSEIREKTAAMHEKFVSPSRSLSPSESIKRHEEKIAKATEARERFLEEKAQKYKKKAKKAEEMKTMKEEQQQLMKKSVETKLQRAEELRKQQLSKIVKKAHDEQSKVNEIQFINTLEAENKRHEILTREKDSEARLHDLQKERQRKNEEKAAKEAAAEERRKLVEAGRQARIEEMQEKRKKKEEKIERQMQNREKERQELASQKAREREQKLSAINAAHQANVEELQKKIQQKQEESKRRHEENIEQIRQKAFELSITRCSAAATSNEDAPGSVPYETKKICSLCKVFIGSEVYLYSHLRGKVHQDAIKVQHCGQTPSSEELECYNLKYIVDAPGIVDSDLNPELARLDRERIKSIKKRCKKLKQKMLLQSSAFESSFKANEIPQTVQKSKLFKCLKDTKKLLQMEKDTCISGPWPPKMVLSLDRYISEMERSLSNDRINICVDEQNAFASFDGLRIFCDLLNKILDSNKDKPCSLPNKTLVHICDLLELVSANNPSNSVYIFNSTIITSELDQLAHRLNLLLAESTPGVVSSRKYDPVIAAISKHLACVINTVCFSSAAIVDRMELNQRVQDVISYTVSVGIVDMLSLCIANAQGPVDQEPELAQFLQYTLSLISALTKLFSSLRTRESGESVFDGSKPEDSSQFIATLKMTQITGVISLVYGILLNTGVSSRSHSPPKQASEHTLNLALESLRLLNHFARVDLQMLQAILGSEGLSLQLRHIASYLLWYCSHWNTAALLHELILLIGYFTVLNADNQNVMQSGRDPQRATILQQLCSLPFEYFSSPKLTRILFPTLISCCFKNDENRAVLQQEMSAMMLSSFIESTIVETQTTAVSKEKEATSGLTGQLSAYDDRLALSVRFPKNRWTEAQRYFDEDAG